MNDAQTLMLMVYIDGFQFPHEVRLDCGKRMADSLCNQVMDGLLEGDFAQVDGLMCNGQRFTMRRKRKNGTKGREPPSWRSYKWVELDP